MELKKFKQKIESIGDIFVWFRLEDQDFWYLVYHNFGRRVSTEDALRCLKWCENDNYCFVYFNPSFLFSVTHKDIIVAYDKQNQKWEINYYIPDNKEMQIKKYDTYEELVKAYKEIRSKMIIWPFDGHRPQKLIYGYDYYAEYINKKKIFKREEIKK